jgi:undecaprenyl-diphosphatase
VRGRRAARVAALALGLFALLAAAVVMGWTQAVDTRLLLLVGGARPGWATPLMRAVSVLGAGELEIPLALLLSFDLWRTRRRSEAAGYAAASLSGWAAYGVLKFAFHRERPHLIPRLMQGGGWYAFPSGHSSLAPIVFGLGALIWSAPMPPRRRAVLFGLAALLSLAVAYSRVYLGMHWPSDVIGGLLLGTGWAATWVWWWERKATGD